MKRRGRLQAYLGSGEHPVRLAPGSRAYQVLGETVMVNSYHHQGIADPGGLTASGWCPEDNLVEVAEDPHKTFTLGVQWHPEDTADFRVFAAFVAAAREYGRARHVATRH